MRKLLLVGLSAMIFMSSCSYSNLGMANQSTELQLRKFDLEISQPKTSTITVTRVFGVDWSRIIKRDEAQFSRNGSTMPVIGQFIGGRDENLGLRALINEHQGTNYDLVMYPKFTVNQTNFIIFNKTEVKVSARFANLKSE